MSRGLAIVLLILTGIIWSTGGFLIKLIPWPPLVIAGLRSGFTAIIIFFDDNSIISLLLFVIETVLGPIILPQPVISSQPEFLINFT